MNDNDLENVLPPRSPLDEPQPTTGPILVIGATGNVGREVVKSLYALGYNVRAAALNEERFAHAPKEANEIVVFDFEKPETFAPACDGVKKMFLMRPPAISDIKTYIKPVIDYAAGVGVEQMAFLSLMGVEKKVVVKRELVGSHCTRE